MRALTLKVAGRLYSVWNVPSLKQKHGEAGREERERRGETGQQHGAGQPGALGMKGCVARELFNPQSGDDSLANGQYAENKGQGGRFIRGQQRSPFLPLELTQAMVPWPFSAWATSDSSFRWESPDGAAERRLSAGPPPRHTEDPVPGEGESGYGVSPKKEIVEQNQRCVSPALVNSTRTLVLVRRSFLKSLWSLTFSMRGDTLRNQTLKASLGPAPLRNQTLKASLGPAPLRNQTLKASLGTAPLRNQTLHIVNHQKLVYSHENTENEEEEDLSFISRQGEEHEVTPVCTGVTSRRRRRQSVTMETWHQTAEFRRRFITSELLETPTAS
ncbi:hypothetical protein EYF80_049622 [Liparis tanakae]|uniref:Uncharacterized protein n=1 Tax=Liparis tanakae TaxID=230148 RepID=A0A4Z2FH26_9TELE|nr:hypothetical protein EYF80_049622 [Liparis tanakae]